MMNSGCSRGVELRTRKVLGRVPLSYRETPRNAVLLHIYGSIFRDYLEEKVLTTSHGVNTRGPRRENVEICGVRNQCKDLGL